MRIQLTTLRWSLLILSVILLGGMFFWLREGASLPQHPSLSKNSSWQLILIKKYELCGHTEIYKSTYNNESELQKVIEQYPNPEIERQPNLYKVTLRISDWCGSCRQNRFLGVENKEVIVRRGTPNKPGPILESTGFLTLALPEAERVDLAKGIPFVDEEEKLELLEGLNSLIMD